MPERRSKPVLTFTLSPTGTFVPDRGHELVASIVLDEKLDNHLAATMLREAADQLEAGAYTEG